MTKKLEQKYNFKREQLALLTLEYDVQDFKKLFLLHLNPLQRTALLESIGSSGIGVPATIALLEDRLKN